MTSSDLPYLAGYPEGLLSQVRRLARSGQLGERVLERYPDPPKVCTDRQLHEYVMQLKNRFLRRSAPLSKICFDEKIGAGGALGMHSYVSRVQGAKTKAKNELRIASFFKTTPPQFLHMVVVHELAHLKEKEHNRAFYQLCQHMEPAYQQYEFDLRLYLTAFGEKPRLLGPR